MMARLVHSAANAMSKVGIVSGKSPVLKILSLLFLSNRRTGFCLAMLLLVLALPGRGHAIEDFSLPGTWQALQGEHKIILGFSKDGRLLVKRSDSAAQLPAGLATDRPYFYQIDAKDLPIKVDIRPGKPAADSLGNTAGKVDGSSTKWIAGTITIVDRHEIILLLSAPALQPLRPPDNDAGVVRLQLERLARDEDERQDDEATVQGRWLLTLKWNDSEEFNKCVVTFSADGRQRTEWGGGVVSHESIEGAWTLYKNRLEWNYDDREVVYRGTIEGTFVQGVMQSGSKQGIFHGEYLD